MRPPRSLALAAALALAPVPVLACSVAGDYRAPTNLELVQQAETIVLARVMAGTPNHADPEASTVRIRPLAALKGPLPDGDIALRGMLLAQDVGGDAGVLSNPYEFREPHPISQWGACIRYVFPLGTTAVFFLRTDHEGMWAPAGDPFSRWAEDVPDAQAPWVQLVRAYVIASGLPEEDRRGFLEDEREALLTRADEPLAQLMAADIARQLGGAGAPPAGLGDRDFGLGVDADGESAVEAALRAMRQAGVEGGN